VKIKAVTPIKTQLRMMVGHGSYVGIREQPLSCKVYRPDGSELPWRLDLYNHSPTGVEWGFFGSGPAQLALAILADCLGDEIALEYYQRFKFKVVGHLPHAGWVLSPEAIDAVIEELEADT